MFTQSSDYLEIVISSQKPFNMDVLYGSIVQRKFEPNVWIGGRKYTLQIKSGHTAQ